MNAEEEALNVYLPFMGGWREILSEDLNNF
jgi:hypothetical protein